MKLKAKISDSVFNAKNCAVCNSVFHTQSHNARYCSVSCKRLFFKEKKRNQKWYVMDPNRGKTLPMGTITSWEIPEDKLVFSGDLESLYPKLSEYLSPEQFVKEKECILKLRPYSETGEWVDSSVQIFTEENFMEVFWISPNTYKFYVLKWENDDERPFKLPLMAI